MVCQARTALCVSKNESKDVIETALVRQTYAGWCGGTAAFAASYPINPGIYPWGEEGHISQVVPSGTIHLKEICFKVETDSKSRQLMIGPSFWSGKRNTKSAVPDGTFGF